ALSAAVGALCRALPPRARPAPDTLRRARFDRPQASLDFWRLLYVLLKQIHRGRWTESDAIGAQVRFVKSALWYHGYGRPQLHQLPADGSAGSRELLLAFSWLLHRLGLLEQLLARNRVQTGDEAAVCTCEDELPNSQEGTAEAGSEGRVDVRYLQWLNGRLRLQWCSLHTQHQEQCKLLHKIHLFTSGSHMDQNLRHFSVTETDLIRRPENYKQLLQLLESETMQLEAFLEWKQLEPIYWQWMVRNQTDFEGKTSGRTQGSLATVLSQSAAVKLRAGKGEANPLQSRVCVSLKMLILHQLVFLSREELRKERFSATTRKIQENVEVKLRGLRSLCAPKRNEMHGSCRLVLRSKHPASTMGFSQCVSREAVSAVSAAEVIRELQVREASLQRELEQLRQECRHRLEEIAEGLEGVICVSP
ncbi:TEDC1 protein, partial [Horornis vulcanius]|nr:TEDC1 protein [Horornis vulcanius]